MFYLKGYDIIKCVNMTAVRIHFIIVQSLIVISYFAEAFGLAQMFREQAHLLSQEDSGIRKNDTFSDVISFYIKHLLYKGVQNNIFVQSYEQQVVHMTFSFHFRTSFSELCESLKSEVIHLRDVGNLYSTKIYSFLKKYFLKMR